MPLIASNSLEQPSDPHTVHPAFLAIFEAHGINLDAPTPSRARLALVSRILASPKPARYSRVQAESGEFLRTRSGIPVRFVQHADDVTTGHPVIGIIDGQIDTWQADGTYALTGEESDLDLFIAEVAL